MDLEKSLKSYIGNTYLKDVIINELVNKEEIESTKKLEYSIIINTRNNRTYEMSYDIKNDEIIVKNVCEIFTELPLSN